MRYVFNMLNSLVKIRVRLAVLNKSALTCTTQFNLVLRACSLRKWEKALETRLIDTAFLKY